MRRRHKQEAPVWAREAAISQRIKSIFALTMLIAIVFTLGSVVFANSPLPQPWIDIHVETLPENAAYVDVLVRISESDTQFVPCNPSIQANGLAVDCDLVRYQVNGYRSYAAHVIGAEPITKIDRNERQSSNYSLRVWQQNQFEYPLYEELKRKFPAIRIALIDQSGSVVNVSPEINTLLFYESFVGDITYSAQLNTVSNKTRPSPFVLVFYFFEMLLAPWIVTVVTETIVGSMFAINPLGYVAAVNGISNLFMNLIIFLFLILSNRSLLPWPILIALELAVIICEYLIYRRKYVSISSRRLLSFSITANATSLLIGLWFNSHLGNYWGL